MYAIIEDSGQQFKVSTGDVILVDVRELPQDAKQISFERVLLVSDDGGGKIGTPLVEGAKVVADIRDAEAKGPKLEIWKHKRRKGYRRHKGHRQQYLQVQIAQIVA